MLRRIFCLVLTFFVLFTFNRVYAQSETDLRIDPTFFNEIVDSNQWVSVIIEFKDEPGIEYWSKSQQNVSALHSTQPIFSVESIIHYQTGLIAKQEDFLQWSDRQGAVVIPQNHITLVLNALSADIHSSSISLLLKNRQVRFIHDDRAIMQPLRQTMSQTTGSDKAWEGIPEANINRLSGKNKLIGIIDTGLERNHLEFNRPRKVRGGYNFVNNNSDFSDQQGHGTHVAGIAAGQGNNPAHRGMAYEADIMVYRVFTPNVQGARNVVAAIDRSVADKCDVINLSLGYAGGENAKGTTAYHRSIANANKAGVFVVAAVGNEGSRRKEIPWTASSPSIVEEAFSVAASNDRKTEAYLILQPGTPSEKRIHAVHGYPTPHFSNELIQKPIVFAGYGSEKELQDLNLSGKIALIKRGPIENGITFRDKLENAMKKGAEGVILFNHTPYEIMTPHLLRENETESQAKHLVPTVMITLEDGQYLQSVISKEYKASITYDVQIAMADFSSMGPTPDAAFKPEISAPGDNIRSTYKTGYATMGGTSMASPSIAGLVTLIKEAHPKWTHEQIKSSLMNTADIMINKDNLLPISFLLQGAGSARVDKALTTPAFVEPRAIIYPSAQNTIEQTFTIQNALDKKQSLRLDAEIFLLEGEENPIEITLPEENLSMEALKDTSFICKFHINSDSMKRNRYEGIIHIGSELHVPFIIYRDSLANVEEPISNIRLSTTQIDFSTDANITHNPIKIYFSINAGTIFSLNQGGSQVTIGRNHADVMVSIMDDEGEIWANIARLNNVVAGEYAIEWSGKNSLNQYFLPRGNYFVNVSMDKNENINNQWVKKPYSTQKQAFQVIASVAPDPITAIFSSLKTFKEFQEFSLDLNLGALHLQSSIGNNPINSISFEINYDPSRVMFRRYLMEGFLKQIESEIDYEVDADDYEGIIRVQFHFDEMDSVLFKNEKSLSFVFRTIGTGRVRFIGKSFRIQLSNNEVIRVKPYMPSIRITNRDFLHADLNNDLIVDRLDFAIFTQAFGSIFGDPTYNADCDFNQDMAIDMIDFVILSKEMGKYI